MLPEVGSYRMENQLIKEPSFSHKNLETFKRKIESKYDLKFENYWEFHQWSVENYPLLWKEAWKFLDIIHSETYEEVVDTSKSFEDIPEWFRGARLNYAENFLRYADDRVAIVITGEEMKVPIKVTFAQLREEVALLSAALRRRRIAKGDTLACFISNKKEAIVAMLAAASVGAFFSATNPLMGAKAVISRFQQISPKILLTVDRYPVDGHERNMMALLPEIVNGLPTLEHVVIVPSNEASLAKDISHIPNSCFYPEFLKAGRESDGSIPAPYFEQLPFSHPLIINYTSGTTGPPKGVVHSAGAALLAPMKELCLHFNITRSDVILAVFSTGWVSWNFFVTNLALGATVVLYEGVPFFRHPTAIWDLIDEQGATIAMFNPVTLEKLEKKNYVPGPHNTLNTVHTILSGSSHVKAHTYDFVQQKIKPDAYFATIFGSTEFIDMFAGYTSGLPLYKEELQVPVLGIDIRCFNEKGESVEDEMGELVIAKPFPSMPLFFWNDEFKRKYKMAFFEKYPGVWCHGDMCVINSRTKGMVILGRSDETIKQRGARFGSSEIYNVVNQMPEVQNSICVSQSNSQGDERALLFIKMKNGHQFNPDFVQAIRETIEAELSVRHVPEIILETKDIPYNMNGKKMEVIVKKIIARAPNVNKESVSNPECLHFYSNIAEIENF